MATGRHGPTLLDAVFSSTLDADLIVELVGDTVPASATVSQLLEEDIDALRARGLSEAACRRLLAAAELARRFQPRLVLAAPITTARQALCHFEPLRTAAGEVLAALFLDARMRPIRADVLATGGMATVAVSPRELFGSALKASACALVIGHNHPSGDCSPSAQDVAFTRSMVAAGELLGVEVVDHLIVSRRGYVSMREHGSWAQPGRHDGAPPPNRRQHARRFPS